MSQSKLDYYELLGITPHATKELIKASYEIARDKLTSSANADGSTQGERRRELLIAYRTLMDDSARARYDQAIKAKASSKSAPPACISSDPFSEFGDNTTMEQGGLGAFYPDPLNNIAPSISGNSARVDSPLYSHPIPRARRKSAARKNDPWTPAIAGGIGLLIVAVVCLIAWVLSSRQLQLADASPKQSPLTPLPAGEAHSTAQRGERELNADVEDSPTLTENGDESLASESDDSSSLDESVFESRRTAGRIVFEASDFAKLAQNETNQDGAATSTSPQIAPLDDTAPIPAFRTYDEVLKAEQSLVFAKTIQRAYESLLEQPDLNEGGRVLVETRLELLKPMVDANAILIEGRFTPWVEFARLAETQETTLVEGLRALSEADGNAALKALRLASEQNATSPVADFVLGLGYALTLRDYSTAERHFAIAKQRSTTYARLLGPNASEVQAAALNNMAIARVRRRDAERAITYWQEAAQSNDNPIAEIKHNIVHLGIYLNDAEAQPQQALLDRIYGKPQREMSELFKMLEINGNSFTSHDASGWHYALPTFDFVNSQPHAVRTIIVSTMQLNDTACLGCDRKCVVACDNCRNGIVSVRRSVPFTNPNGTVINRSIAFDESCPKCRGRGQLRCAHCASGEEVLPH